MDGRLLDYRSSNGSNSGDRAYDATFTGNGARIDGNQSKRSETQVTQRRGKINDKMKGRMSVLLHTQGRFLIREGILKKLSIKDDSEEKMYVFLFTDMLLFSKEGKRKRTSLYDYKKRIPLSMCSASELDQS